jgi:PAS domain S-box-containing protein
MANAPLDSIENLNQVISQNQELETLFNTLPMPVLFKDNQLRYQRANQAACGFMGLDASQIIGRCDADFLPADLASERQQWDRLTLLQPKGLITPDTAWADAQGDLHYFSIYKSPVISQDGELLGLLEVALDVTERKLAESERLTDLQRQRDALVQEVHHRIKNHLQGVVGLLQRSIVSTPNLAQPLTSVLAQIESIAGIHGLQSRLGSQCLTMGQVVAMIADLTPDAISITGDGMGLELPQQEAVPFALIINELVSNAFKHQQSISGKLPNLVTIDMSHQQRNFVLQVGNSPAYLPSEFDFSAGIGLGTGLRLLRNLLPKNAAKLTFRQQYDQVIAELIIMPDLLQR